MGVQFADARAEAEDRKAGHPVGNRDQPNILHVQVHREHHLDVQERETHQRRQDVARSV